MSLIDPYLFSHVSCCCLSGRKSCGHSRLMVSEWSEEDVLAWLREEGLEAVIDVFKSNNIDGEELLSLTKETLSSDLHIGKITARITQYWYSCHTLLYTLDVYFMYVHNLDNNNTAGMTFKCYLI